MICINLNAITFNSSGVCVTVLFSALVAGTYLDHLLERTDCPEAVAAYACLANHVTEYKKLV